MKMKRRHLNRKVSNSCHSKLDSLRVRRTSKESKEGFLGVSVQCIELIAHVLTCSIKVHATFLIRKLVLHGHFGQLLLEQVNLVEKEKHSRHFEPRRVANRVK
jgi:hypothetical protein